MLTQTQSFSWTVVRLRDIVHWCPYSELAFYPSPCPTLHGSLFGLRNSPPLVCICFPFKKNTTFVCNINFPSFSTIDLQNSHCFCTYCARNPAGEVIRLMLFLKQLWTKDKPCRHTSWMWQWLTQRFSTQWSPRLLVIWVDMLMLSGVLLETWKVYKKICKVVIWWF